MKTTTSNLVLFREYSNTPVKAGDIVLACRHLREVRSWVAPNERNKWKGSVCIGTPGVLRSVRYVKPADIHMEFRDPDVVVVKPEAPSLSEQRIAKAVAALNELWGMGEVADTLSKVADEWEKTLTPRQGNDHPVRLAIGHMRALSESQRPIRTRPPEPQQPSKWELYDPSFPRVIRHDIGHYLAKGTDGQTYEITGRDEPSDENGWRGRVSAKPLGFPDNANTHRKYRPETFGLVFRPIP